MEHVPSVELEGTPAMAASPPSQLHDSELLLSRPRAALPRRWHFISLLAMSSIEILCDAGAPYVMFMALIGILFPGGQDPPEGSGNIMSLAYIWVLVNLVLHAMSRLVCCVLTGVHLTQGRFGTVQKQVWHSALSLPSAAKGEHSIL
jgi:hypothetical protein